MLRNLRKRLGGQREIERLRTELRNAQRDLARQENRFIRQATYYADGLATWQKNTAFLKDPKFVEAYHRGVNSGHKLGDLHIEWRVHVACWAASHALKLPGDFVECGVNTGIFSLAIAHYIDFNSTNKSFYLFDTFSGIPDSQISPEERKLGRDLEYALAYEDCYDLAKSNFAPYPNTHLVRGIVPDSLDSVDIEQVCYLSLDMNIVAPEIAALRHFWPKLSSGAPVLMDDYGWTPYVAQKEAMDEFAASVGCEILTLPTGQGLLLKP